MFGRKKKLRGQFVVCEDKIKDFVHDCRTPLVTVDIALEATQRFLSELGNSDEIEAAQVLRLVENAKAQVQRINKRLTVLGESCNNAKQGVE